VSKRLDQSGVIPLKNSAAETYRFKDNFEPIFDVFVVLNKKLIALERNHLNLC
jgi:hypothetical protein